MKLQVEELNELRDTKNNLQNEKQTLQTQLCELESEQEEFTKNYLKMENELKELQSKMN